MSVMSNLTENQRRAVEWDKKPLLVLGGPGSGKTVVLTMRLARLIKESPNARFRVLGLTFTRTAANVIREKVEHLLGSEARRARVMTYHSFCIDVLRQHGSHLGLRPDFEIVTQDADRLQILNEAIREADVSNTPMVDSHGMLMMLDHLHREGYDGGDDLPFPFSETGRAWIRSVYDSYMEIQLRNNHLDFGSLLVCCIRLFRNRPRLAKHFGIVYPYVCVDEYLETYKAQELLLRATFPKPDANVFVVANPQPIIYRLSDASIERLEKLRSDYEMPIIRLPENYQCPAEVVDLANNIIQVDLEQSLEKVPLTPTLARQNVHAVRVQRFPEHFAEMEWIAKDIRQRCLLPHECAILARNTKLLRAAIDALQRADLSPYLVERMNEFESPPVRFVHSALRLVNSPRERYQIRSLCKAFLDLTGVNVRVEDAEAISVVYGGSLLRGFIAVAEASPVASADSAFLLHALREQLVERLKFQEFSEAVFNWSSKYRGHPDGIDANVDETDEILVWNNLKREVWERCGDAPTLSQFLQELDLRSKPTPPSLNQIQCLTIHLTKGKEFPHVYLIGLAEGQLPSFRAKQNSEDSREIEEERRICLVAITRAQSTLTLTLSDSYFGQAKEPSRFLSEMGLAAELARVSH